MEENGGMPEWLLEDNRKRKDHYVRDLDEEVFIRQFNDVLAREFPLKGDEPGHPMLFFFGLPRCGKTFFSQVLTNCLDLGYPDNLTARFWRAPHIGITLSKILRRTTDAETSFSSDHGKTRGVLDPHDFAYFWHEHLKINVIPYDYQSVRTEINWSNLRKALQGFTNAFGKACIMKGVNPSYHINEMAAAYEKSLFIYVKRDSIDCAVSLYRARQKNFGNLEQWYGQTPSSEVYDQLKSEPYNIQIGGQLKHLSKLYDSQLEKLDPSRYLIVDYREFCSNPTREIQKIVDRVKENFDYEIKIQNDVKAESVVYSSHSSELAYYGNLLAGLEHFGQSARLNELD